MNALPTVEIMVLKNAVHNDLYADSVALMRVAARLAEGPGLTTVSLVMGTPANKDVLAGAGLLTDEGSAARPNDLVVAVRGEAAQVAAAVEEAALALRQSGPVSAEPPGTEEDIPLRSLTGAPPEADLAVISTPGIHAAAETRKAIRRGMNAFVFSDHMSVEDEIDLKREADRRGLLVMGPDCGTAVIDGVPLGFANVLRRGPVGLAGASGTGLQQVSCLLHARGVGVSHIIGTGSRDLSREVGGRTVLAAVDALAADPATEVIVLVSKPPDPEVAERVLHRAAASGKPVVACFLGWDGLVPAGVTRAHTLAAAAAAAVALMGDRAGAPAGREPGTGEQPVRAPAPGSPRGLLRALYTGGTFAHEAEWLLRPRLGAMLRSTPPPGPGAAPVLPDGHLVLDLGDDAFTAGRPHPMIDPTVRTACLRAALTDPRTAVVILDVVLGHGAAADPAGSLAAILAETETETGAETGAGAGTEAGSGTGSGTGSRTVTHVRARPTVIAFVVGTDLDPQPFEAGRRLLREAGAIVVDSGADAASLAATLLEPDPAATAQPVGVRIGGNQ